MGYGGLPVRPEFFAEHLWSRLEASEAPSRTCRGPGLPDGDGSGPARPGRNGAPRIQGGNAVSHQFSGASIDKKRVLAGNSRRKR